MKKNKVLFALALVGILLFCGWIFVQTTDAWASIEGLDRVMRIKQMFHDSIR